MLERGKMDRNVIEMVEIDGLVPEGHLTVIIVKLKKYVKIKLNISPNGKNLMTK